MGELIYINLSSIIGFFVIVLALGYMLHRLLSKTNIYNRKVKGKGFLFGFLYTFILLMILYALLLIIFGVIHLIDL